MHCNDGTSFHLHPRTVIIIFVAVVVVVAAAAVVVVVVVVDDVVVVVVVVVVVFAPRGDISLHMMALKRFSMLHTYICTCTTTSAFKV